MSRALSGLLIYRPAFAAKRLQRRRRRRQWRRRCRLLNEILNFSALANSRDKAIALYDCSYAPERERERLTCIHIHCTADPIDRWLLNKNKNNLDKYVCVPIYKNRVPAYLTVYRGRLYTHKYIHIYYYNM